MPSSAEILKSRLTEELASKKMSGRALGRDAGLTPTQANEYINGGQTPTLAVLDRIAEALHTEAWELIRPHSQIPSALLAAIERMDPRNYAQLGLIVEGFLRAEGKLESRGNDHQSRQKLK